MDDQQNLLDYETIVKCYVDEHLKQSIALKLLEEISNYPLEEAEADTI